MPEGLYVLVRGAELTRGAPVAYQPSPPEAGFLEARRYTARRWPLVKRVAALGGDEACRHETTVRVNGIEAARALEADSAGRALPAWSGCRQLGRADVLLLADHPSSLDGRYFGVQARRRVLGVLVPVWLPAAPATSGRQDGTE